MAIKKNSFKVIAHKPEKSVSIKAPKSSKFVKATPIRVKMSTTLKRSSYTKKPKISAAKSDIKN